MKRHLPLTAACTLALCAAVSPANAKENWAECLWLAAPASAQNWIDLGKLGKKTDQAVVERSENLAFRLKAACAKVVAPKIEIEEVRFDRNAVWQALSKSAAGVRLSNGADERDPNAFKCKMYFLLDAVGEDVRAIPGDVLRKASMQIDAYQVLAPTDEPIMLTKAKRSNDEPINIVRKCQRIGTDGNLVDA